MRRSADIPSVETNKAFKHAQTVVYYLVVESRSVTWYIDRLESLCSTWLTDPESHILDAAIVTNVPIGYLSETLAAVFHSRMSSAALKAPTHAGGPPQAGARFETVCFYFAAHPDFRERYYGEIKALEELWKYGEGKPAAGLVSSITAISIDFEDIDRWLVACIVCCYLWHPDKDNPVKDQRYEALLRVVRPEVPPIEKLDIERIKKLGGTYPIIETKDLRRKHLPVDDSIWFDPHNEGDPRSPMALALSFAGYEFLDVRLFDLLATVEQIAFDGQPRVLECFNTTGLRLLLFGLQRRFHNADTGLETNPLTRAILAQLRGRLSS
jgi:SAM-dependent methyltransferase